MCSRYLIILFVSCTVSCGSSETSLPASDVNNYSQTYPSSNDNNELVPGDDSAASMVIDSVTREAVYQEQQKEIENINEENVKLAEVLTSKQDKIETLEEDNSRLTKQLDKESTKYYYYGSRSELFHKGILEREGFIPRKDFNEDVSKKMLMSIDISKTEFCTGAKIKHIYPSRAKESYNIDDGCLYITDKERFWEFSDVLIILTK